MKRNTATIILIFTLAALSVLQYILNNKQVTRLRKNLSIEQSINSYIKSHMLPEQIPFDSVYAQNDTIRFYKKGIYQGMTVSVTE